MLTGILLEIYSKGLIALANCIWSSAAASLFYL
jgi:hypothetical protein